jgi:WD40 repeat protein/beta-lactamase regulating signal transducer with metallopeptidase domain
MIKLISKFVLLQVSYPGIALVIVSAVKSAAIVITAWAAVSFLRARSARARCWIWRCSLFGVIVLLVSDFGPAALRSARLVFPVEPAGERPRALFITVPESEWAGPPADDNTVHETVSPPVRNPAREDSVQKIVVEPPNYLLFSPADVEAYALRIWAWGTACLVGITAIRLLAGQIWLKRHRQSAGVSVRLLCQKVAAQLGVKSDPRVWINQGLHSPLLIGLSRPRIYLPDAVRSTGPNGLISIFVHELAHWIRRDVWWHYLGKIAVCSFWWNPLVALAAQRMRAEAEEAADDWVLKHGIAAESYAAILLQLASTANDLRPSIAGVSMLGYRSLRRRMEAMLQKNPWRGKLGWGAVTAIGLTTCLFLFLCVVYIQAAHAERSIHFVFHKPEAKAVFLAGDFNDWNTMAVPMRLEAGGNWTRDVLLPPGQYSYKFVADGEWFPDPANPEHVPNRFDTLDSVLVVGKPHGESIDWERDALVRQTALLFSRGDYARLDAQAKNFRSSRARFADGSWKLRAFYEALEPAQFFIVKEDWEAWFGKMAEWKLVVPDSITAAVVEAQGWAHYAEKANDRTEHERRRERMKQILFGATNLPERCPQWYALTLDVVAMPEGWSEEEIKRVLAEAAPCGRDYYNLYFEAACYKPTGPCGLYGKEASWPQKAEKFSREFDPAEGLTSYARMAWRKAQYFSNLFEESPITWDKLKTGFRDMETQYPNSRVNLNAFLQFALLARDKETARALYQQIGEDGDESWNSYARYQLWRDWADPTTPAWRTTPKLATPRGERPYTIHSIAFSPDGKTLLSCDASGQVILRSVGSGNIVWQTSFGAHPARSVAFSRNGLSFAAAGFQDNIENESGLVRVWSTDSFQEIAHLRPEIGNAFAVAFLSDDRKLAIAGGNGSQLVGYVWDVPTNQVRPLNFPGKGRSPAMALSASPDLRTLIISCYRSIVFYDLAENRVLSVKDTTRNFTRAAAFSPDGKVAVTAGTPNSRRVLAPGTVSFWDMTACSEKPIRIEDGTGGVFTVAFSPDGKVIAGGGMDHAVHIWDAGTARSKAVFLGHDRDVMTVAFSPDSKTIASAGEDGVIKFWQLPQ